MEQYGRATISANSHRALRYSFTGWEDMTPNSPWAGLRLLQNATLVHLRARWETPYWAELGTAGRRCS